ncbi:MAG: hypothetical protein BWY85_00377 [Firmicutes bacterium ADurb.Bin506]|nr:MAG: hypothetical protein BWY85_00377 [Firmicutes bacterium ADurb.Bin506]
MSNNFVREGNLSGDAVLDWVAQKVFFESVKIGTGSPSAAPSPASKVWLYADRSQNPAIMWLWDPSTATWHITGDGTGTGVVDSVNGQTGIVVLDHTDVGAEEAGAVADLAATLATVATSGDYDDLINKPTIPDISNLVEDTDPRLSDARTPTAHTHPQSDVTGLVSDLAAKVADTDPRLSDARTPLTHTHSLVGLSDVDDTGVGDGDTLVYDDGLWVPGALRDPLFGRVRQFTGNSTGGPGPYALTTTPADIPHSFISGSWVSDFSPPDLLVGRRYQATVQFSIGADDPGVLVGAQLVTADNLKIFRVLYNGLVSGMNDVVIPFLLSVSNVNYQTLRLQVLSPTGAAVTVRCVWRQGHTVAVSFRAVDIGPIPT